MSIQTLPKDKEPCPNEFNEIIRKALHSLNIGAVVAVPTDTIYGIAAFSQSTPAVDKLYEIKKRHREKAIAICVGNIEEVKRWGKVTVSDEVLHDLLPGAVTLIFKRSAELNPNLNPATDSIGIRIPKCEFIQQLAQACKQPLALTSANISSAMSALKIEEFKEIWPQLDLIVDAGAIGNTEESRLGSTVVDLSSPGEFLIIRKGCTYQHVMYVLEEKHKLRNKLEP